MQSIDIYRYLIWFQPIWFQSAFTPIRPFCTVWTSLFFYLCIHSTKFKTCMYLQETKWVQHWFDGRYWIDFSCVEHLPWYTLCWLHVPTCTCTLEMFQHEALTKLVQPNKEWQERGTMLTEVWGNRLHLDPFTSRKITWRNERLMVMIPTTWWIPCRKGWVRSVILQWDTRRKTGSRDDWLKTESIHEAFSSGNHDYERTVR